MAVRDYIRESEIKLGIMLNVLKEIQAELQDGELDAALLDLDDGGKKIVEPEEFYSEEYPNEYEVPKNYER